MARSVTRYIAFGTLKSREPSSATVVKLMMACEHYPNKKSDRVGGCMPLGFARILLPLPFIALLSAPSSSLAASTDDCNLSKTNSSCTIVIDRENPIAPATIQMYSQEKLTVVVKNPLSQERYFLDYTTGAATITPDVASSIVQGLFPSLQAVIIRNAPAAFPPGAAPPPPPCTDPITMGTTRPAHSHLSDAIQPFRTCLVDFAQKARAVYQKLEPYVAPDSITPGSDTHVNLTHDALISLENAIDPVLTQEFTASANITTLAGDDNYKAKPADPGKPATPTAPAVPPQPAVSVDPRDAEAIAELTNLQKAADAIAADLLGYRQRLRDLEGSVNNPRTPVSLRSRQDDPSVYQNMVSRTVTYSLDALNLVANSQEAAPDPTKKRAVATIVIVFADSPKTALSAFRWEASAGVFFSSLPNRSFSVAPVYNGTTVADNTVHQSDLRPTAVPFAAGNYRLTDDLSWSRWKSNVYWTFAVGVNPNTKTADFATGPSISWRALMFSALAHWGQETRLSGGFTNGESLGPTFTGTLPTEPHWTLSFALGISVRIPSLTGR